MTDEAKMKRPTVKALQTQLLEITDKAQGYLTQLQTANCLKREAEDREKTTRGQFDDLKKRLHKSETEVARLNGYIARVREDDTVREELVTTGDPEGGQRLVPKRKHECLGDREYDVMDCLKGNAGSGYGYEERRKPKHWIEY